MAKTRYQNETIKQEFRRQRRRIQSAIKRLKEEGRIVNYTLPAIPKKVTEASVKKLKKITPKYLRSKSEVYDVDTMEFVTGWKANRVVREKKERYKERWGKNWREEKRKNDAKIEHQRFLDEIARERDEELERQLQLERDLIDETIPDYTPDEEASYDYSDYYDTDYEDTEYQQTTPEHEIKDIQPNADGTSGTIEYEETDEHGNKVEVFVDYEVDPQTGEMVEKPETTRRRYAEQERSREDYPDVVDIILDNVREAFERWLPPDNLDLASQKQNDKDAGSSLLEQAIAEFGERVVAERLENYAGNIWDLLDTIMYSGYRGDVNYAMMEFRNILFGGMASEEDAMELQDMMDYYDEMGDY